MGPKVIEYDANGYIATTPISSDVTELPDSFGHSIHLAVESTKEAISLGKNRLRIDFDTSLGDMTYTTLKNSLPLAKEFAKLLGLMVLEKDKIIQVTDEKTGETSLDYTGKKLAVFFPDTGSSVWAQQDWDINAYKTLHKQKQEEKQKLEKGEGEINNEKQQHEKGEGEVSNEKTDMKKEDNENTNPKVKSKSMVPPSIRLTAFQDGVVDLDTDDAFIFLCPRFAEAEAVNKLIKQIPEDKPIVLINPELIDTGVVGFGLAGRRIKDNIEKLFERVYYLKTLNWGAVNRKWPQGYSIWFEDANVEGGYRHIKTYSSMPEEEEIESAYELANPSTEVDGVPTKKENKVGGVLNELAKFIDGFQKL